MSQMSTNVLREWQEVEALAERWSALLERSHANSIFLTPEWIFAWRKAMQGIDLEPVVVVVEASDGELLGVAPFYLGVQYLVNAVPYRVLRVMGDFPTGSVYSDVIACPEQEQAVYEQVMAELVRFPCDGLWVPHVAPWTGASERLEQAAQRNGFSVDIRDSEFYVIDLPDTFEAYEMTLSKSTRKDFRRASRKLLNDAGAQVHVCKQQDEVGPMLDDLIRLNTARWADTERRGVFERKPREAAFYKHFAPVALAKGWLRLLTLELDGVAYAAEYGYRYNDRYFSLQTGYDREGPPGVGKVLLNQMLKRELESGAKQFDLLVGDASYKSSYGARERHCHEFFLLQPSIKTLPLRVGKVWPRGRYLDMTYPRRRAA